MPGTALKGKGHLSNTSNGSKPPHLAYSLSKGTQPSKSCIQLWHEHTCAAQVIARHMHHRHQPTREAGTPGRGCLSALGQPSESGEWVEKAQGWAMPTPTAWQAGPNSTWKVDCFAESALPAALAPKGEAPACLSFTCFKWSPALLIEPWCVAHTPKKSPNTPSSPTINKGARKNKLRTWECRAHNLDLASLTLTKAQQRATHAIQVRC